MDHLSPAKNTDLLKELSKHVEPHELPGFLLSDSPPEGIPSRLGLSHQGQFIRRDEAKGDGIVVVGDPLGHEGGSHGIDFHVLPIWTLVFQMGMGRELGLEGGCLFQNLPLDLGMIWKP